MDGKNPLGPPTNIDEPIARYLAALHKEHELTLAQLAERCAVSKAMISHIERNQNSPTASVLGRLASGLGVAPSELLSGAQAPTEPLCRYAQQGVWEGLTSGYRHRQVGACDPRNGCETVEVKILANVHLDYPRWGDRLYRQRLWLVEGALRVGYGK